MHFSAATHQTHTFLSIHTTQATFQSSVLVFQRENQVKTHCKSTLTHPRLIPCTQSKGTTQDTAISLCKSLHNFSCQHRLPDTLQSSSVPPKTQIPNAAERVRTGIPIPVCVSEAHPNAHNTHTAHTHTHTHAYSWLRRFPKPTRDAAATGTTNSLPAMTAGDLCPPSAFSHTCKVKASRGSSISAFNRS